MLMALGGGVDPHGNAAAHGFQGRCQRWLTSSSIIAKVGQKYEIELSTPESISGI